MRWILVTGAAKGLGAEICLELARQKYNVLIHYNKSEAEAASVRDQCRGYGAAAEIVQGDFSTGEMVFDFIRRAKGAYPDIHSVVNNVGNYLAKTALQTSSTEWLDLFQTNFHAPFQCIQALAESVIKNRGAIVNVGMAGMNTGTASIHCPAYLASKGLLLTLTRSLAKELALKEVSVNMVSPGYMVNSVEFPTDPSTIPIGRPAELQEVARVVAFLLDEKNKYITGQNIEVAGGVGL